MAKSTRSSESEGRRSKGRRSSGEESSSSSKSVGAMIGESLGDESQEAIERVFGEVRRYMDSTKEYISENPKEAAGLAIAAGFATWALLGTKPGRMIFERGAGMAVPQVTRWFSRNIGGMTGGMVEQH